MSLYKRKKKYWINVRINGSRERIPTGTENKKLAESIHAKVLVDIQEGKWFETQHKKRLLSEMIERYKAEYSEQKDYYQKRRDRSIFNHLYSYFGEESTLENVESMVGGYEHYRRAKGKKPSTIVKELGLLRRMFNIARKQWKWKLANPVSDIEMPKVRNERVRYLTPDEYKALCNSLEAVPEKWLKPVVIIAIETGLRLSNLCNLKWTDVNLFSKMITIQAEKMKNDDYIGIPLTERAYKALIELHRTQDIAGMYFITKAKIFIL